MNREEALKRLTEMLPGEFELVCERVGIPHSILPGPQAPQTTRAIDLLRWAARSDTSWQALEHAIYSPAPSSAPQGDNMSGKYNFHGPVNLQIVEQGHGTQINHAASPEVVVPKEAPQNKCSNIEAFSVPA